MSGPRISGMSANSRSFLIKRPSLKRFVFSGVRAIGYEHTSVLSEWTRRCDGLAGLLLHHRAMTLNRLLLRFRLSGKTGGGGGTSVVANRIAGRAKKRGCFGGLSGGYGGFELKLRLGAGTRAARLALTQGPGLAISWGVAVTWLLSLCLLCRQLIPLSRRFHERLDGFVYSSFEMDFVAC